MTRAFSLPSESLSYFIGFTLLHCDPVVVVSPWLSDVSLSLPINDRFESREVSLVEALATLSEKEIHLLVRSGESHNDYIKRRLPEHVHVQEIEGLHAKAVVSDSFVYLGSANITRGGLTLNRELCEVIENEYGSATEYVKLTLDLTV
ncbi:phospholipase D-like domain-containing protein [Halorubrum sp. N11]|uniref:phospholipase D-like domain-containing protein n=1 Tax=Halorubrum sp. N11 TaxID=3402276 RepID=UPI003EBD5AC6